MEADPSMHSVVIASHLWRALEVMARDMAVEPSVLVNQAVFAWLRINGYVAPGTVGQLAKSLAPPVAADAPPPPPPRPGLRSSLSPTPSVSPVAPPKPEPVDPSAAALAGIVSRLEEIEGDVNRLVQPRPAWARPPEEKDPELEASGAKVTPAPVPVPVPVPVEEDRQLLAAVELDGGLAPVTGPITGLVESVEEGTVLLRSSPMAAFVQREGEMEVRVAVDRFIIGRGPQCDLVIDSPRVSREHVALLRLGVTYVLEDLGSSNGTWFNEERISRRELESGDVVRLGSELVTFFLRGDQ